LLVEAAALKQSFAVRALFSHALAVERPLSAGRIEGARDAVALMVSRATAELDQTAVASAAIESLAENASDSAGAPWAWFAVLGLPGAFAYRAVNTLDAMIGYRDRGLAGTPSARLDDALNVIPARLTAVAVALASGARMPGAVSGALADAGRTPSPNSGWPMAAAAHALGVRLEKRGHHVLNEQGSAPTAATVGEGRLLVAKALAIAFTIALAVIARPGMKR
jgi:adenosylcobinamide-phosphate synthase